MAVFPDRIVLKNSTDEEATIITEIQTGGVSAITQGELVLGLSEGAAALYTKDALGNIVTISGSGGNTDDLPTVTGSTIDSDATADTSHTLASPTSTSGDLLVACIMHRAGGGTLTPPSGFTLYGSYLSSITFSGSNQTISVFTKTVTASEPATYTWTQVSSDRICGWVAAVGGTNGIDSITESYGNAETATIDIEGEALTLTAATWVYAATSSDEVYSQTGTGLVEITDSPQSNARISGGYVAAVSSAATTITSTHAANTTDNSPNHGMIAIRMLTPTSSSGGGTGGLVFWGGGDFTTGLSDGEQADGGEFTV